MAEITNKKEVRLRAIKGGLEKSLVTDTSDLVFKTFKLVYHMDKDAIICDPFKFESILRRMFGDSAEQILKAISDSAKGKRIRKVRVNQPN